MRRLRKPVCRVGAVVRLALGAAALAMAGGLYAAGLFQPVSAADVESVTKSTSLQRSASDAWERPVVIDRHELTAARDEIESAGAGRLLLNVRNGVRLDVVVERTAATLWGYSLSGRVAGERVGFVTLVVHEDAVAGSIWTPDSAYELSYLGDGIHVLRDVTTAPLFECGGALPHPEFSDMHAAAHQGGTDDGSVVDILVVWTPKAEDAYGGLRAPVLSRIDMSVAHANDTFRRSGALVALNLVGAEKVDYVEVDRDAHSTNLVRLSTLDDGFLDTVHNQRDALGADLVYLLTAEGGGRAELGGPFSVGGGSSYIFTHEIGHNLGLQHERIEIGAGLGPYSHGFTTRNCVVTIMSYGGRECSRGFISGLPLFASPWRYSPRDGSALGVTRFSRKRGARGPADAVLTLNRNRYRVANFRSTSAGSNR